MKRSFLENLGITDKDVVDKIMAENGTDIQREKSRWESTNNELEATKTTLSQREARIGELEKSAGDVDKLTKQVTDLTNEKNSLVDQHSKELGSLRLNHGLESLARDMGARNVKAALALLDMTKITLDGNDVKGAKEQFDTLKAADDTKFLFGDASGIKGAEPGKGTPPEGGGTPTPKSFGEAIASYYQKKD